MENLHGRGFPYSPGELNFQSSLHSSGDGQTSFSQGGVSPQISFPYLQSVTNAAYHHPSTYQSSNSDRDALGGSFGFARYQDSINPLHPSVPDNTLPHLPTFHSGQTDSIERSRMSSPHLRQPYDTSTVNPALMESSVLGLPTTFPYGSQPNQFGQTPENLASSFFTSASSTFSTSNFLMQANRLHGLPSSVSYDTSTSTADVFNSHSITTSRPFQSNLHDSLPPISIPKKRQFLPDLTSSDTPKTHTSFSPDPLTCNKPDIGLQHCIPAADTVSTTRSESLPTPSLSPGNSNDSLPQSTFASNSCQDFTDDNNLAGVKQSEALYLGPGVSQMQQKTLMDNLNDALSSHSHSVLKSPRSSLLKSPRSFGMKDGKGMGKKTDVNFQENEANVSGETNSFNDGKDSSLEETQHSENENSDVSEDEIINDQPRVKFVLKGKLARQNFHHLRPTHPIMDFSFEAPLYSELDYAYAANMFAYTRIRRESLSRPQHISLDKPNIFMESNCAYDGNFSYMEDDSDNDKDGTGTNKRKARKPSFYQSQSSQSGDKEFKAGQEELNEEYLVQSKNAAEMLNYFRNSAGEEDANLSPEARKAKMKLQPYAITSPSFSRAAARAVMTTTVSNNATVVTISIANKKTFKKGKTKCVNSVEGSVMSTGMTEEEGAEGDSLSDENEDVNNSSKDEEDIMGTGKVGIERTSIMSKLKRDTDNSGNDQSDDGRMEINIRIDDSQLIQHGEQKRWQCHLCEKSYTTKHNLVTHILDHNGIKPHLCMVCGKYFKQLSHLNTHMLTHDNIKPHVCTVCSKGFTQISHLKRHQAVHLENRPYICDICERGFAYPSELRTHKEKHATGKENKCVDCGEEFDCQRALKQHQVIHGNCENLICKYCNKVFRYPSQLKDHLICHEGARQYICGECGMDFMKEHHLRAHQFTHSGQRPWSCPQCGRRFNQKANMQRHMLIHNATRAYKCETCGKTFTQPQTLKAHLVVHAEKKPYQCKFCGKQFGRLHNLQGHMHMHNNSKPYICFCGSSFTLKGNLNRHKKVKHDLNETTESMEEEAVNFLSELSERSRVEADEENEHENDLEEENLTADTSLYRKNRKSVPRKFQRSSFSEDDEDYSDADVEDEVDEPKVKEENVDENYSTNNVSSKEDKSPDVERKQLRKRKRKAPERVSTSGNDNTAELTDSDRDENVKEEMEDHQDSDWIPKKSKRQKISKGVKLDSIIAEKFKNV